MQFHYYRKKSQMRVAYKNRIKCYIKAPLVHLITLVWTWWVKQAIGEECQASRSANIQRISSSVYIIKDLIYIMYRYINYFWNLRLEERRNMKQKD